MAPAKNKHKDEQDKDISDQPYGISDTEIEEIADTLHSNYEEALIEQISELSPADSAELLSKISNEDRERLINEHSEAFTPEVFTEIAPELRKDILEKMPATQVASLITELNSDDALDLILNLEVDFQQDIIRQLSVKMRLTLEEGLNFPEDSAGRLMQREFVAIPHFWTVDKTLDYIRKTASELPSEFFDIFAITPAYKITGEIPLSAILRAGRDEILKDITLDDLHLIPATMDQEEVAQIFRRENLTSAPVIDEAERVIGVITIDDVVDVIDEEADEDLLRLAGVEKDGMYSAVLSTTTKRFRWLFINLLTAILASIVISFFDATIEQIVALAILMPIVASMGGNAGTQALTVAVRALAKRELSKTNAYRTIWKETIIGTLNGSAFALIMGSITALWFGSPMLGFVIAAAMIINLICAGFFGAGIPIMLERAGSDPAVSSTVLLTTITDIVGFLAFLGLASILLI